MIKKIISKMKLNSFEFKTSNKVTTKSIEKKEINSGRKIDEI
jgi:hypothetical protein